MKLLLIPGSGAGREAWGYQTEYFAGSEGISLPGHPEGEPCTSVDDCVEWLRNYIHQKGYQDVVLAGHSLGGAVAQLYGLKYPDELKALILVGTGARLKVRPAILDGLRQMIGNQDAWRNSIGDPSSLADPILRQATEARLRIGPAIRLNDLLCCDEFDIMGEIQNIKLPTLVLCGTEDQMTPVKYTKYLTDRIEGATEVIIDGGTHMVFMEKPQEVNQAIEEFLATLG